MAQAADHFNGQLPPEPPWAHSKADTAAPAGRWHGLVDCLQTVGQLSAGFAAHVGPEWGRPAGLWHNLGRFRRGLRVERAPLLWSDALGLIGKADMVEFEPDGTPYPVEHEQCSRQKAADIAACDDVQLAAEATCLEEMTRRVFNEGALCCAISRRRRVVAVDGALRQQVRDARDGVAAMLAGVMTPLPLTTTGPSKKVWSPPVQVKRSLPFVPL